MIILGIETSCDETAAAVLSNNNGRIQILSNIVASSASLQAKYGGIIPEQAAREQIKSIIPVIQEGLQVAGYSGQNIDAIAVTFGPGLIGSLLVGVETAKTLSLIWNKPLIPINHLIGHFYANWIDCGSSPLQSNNNYSSTEPEASGEVPKFPCIGLLVSGGHTDLVLFTDHGKYKYLGGTRDDAAGECFDKCARLLGLPYPGGPEISKLAKNGDPKKIKLPKPMWDSKDFDFSFSGLKTAVSNLMQKAEQGDIELLANLASSIETTIAEVLVKKATAACQKYQIGQLIVAGGVAANQKLASELQNQTEKLGIKLYIPPANLCTDNGAMIASAAFFEPKRIPHLNLQADPNLSLAY